MYFPTAQFPWAQDQHKGNENRHYCCKICNRRHIQEYNLHKHFSKYHKNVPYDMNFFEYMPIPIVVKTENPRRKFCEVGNDMQKNMERHHATNEFKAVKCNKCYAMTIMNVHQPDYPCWKCNNKTLEEHFKEYNENVQQVPAAYGGFDAKKGPLNDYNAQKHETIGFQSNFRQDVLEINGRETINSERGLDSWENFVQNCETSQHTGDQNPRRFVENIPPAKANPESRNKQLKLSSRIVQPRTRQGGRTECLICSVLMTKREIEPHHKKYHSTMLFTKDFYEISKKTQTINCTVCNESVILVNRTKHMRRMHRFNPEKNQSDVEKLEILKHFDFVTMKFYRCRICYANGIKGINLMKHHTENHDEIPFDTNNFQLFAAEKSNSFIECKICQQHLSSERANKHVCSLQDANCNQSISSISQNFIIATAFFECQMCNNQQPISDMELKEHQWKFHPGILENENIFDRCDLQVNELCPICDGKYDEGMFQEHMEHEHQYALIFGGENNGEEEENIDENTRGGAKKVKFFTRDTAIIFL